MPASRTHRGRVEDVDTACPDLRPLVATARGLGRRGADRGSRDDAAAEHRGAPDAEGIPGRAGRSGGEAVRDRVADDQHPRRLVAHELVQGSVSVEERRAPVRVQRSIGPAGIGSRLAHECERDDPRASGQRSRDCNGPPGDVARPATPPRHCRENIDVDRLRPPPLPAGRYDGQLRSPHPDRFGPVCRYRICAWRSASAQALMGPPMDRRNSSSSDRSGRGKGRPAAGKGSGKGRPSTDGSRAGRSGGAPGAASSRGTGAPGKAPQRSSGTDGAKRSGRASSKPSGPGTSERGRRGADAPAWSVGQSRSVRELGEDGSQVGRPQHRRAAGRHDRHVSAPQAGARGPGVS